jgi:hypothetical protein
MVTSFWQKCPLISFAAIECRLDKDGWKQSHKIHQQTGSHAAIDVLRPRIEEMMNAYRILVRKRERKRLHGRLGRRWEDNIRTDLKEIGWESAGWIYLIQDKD